MAAEWATGVPAVASELRFLGWEGPLLPAAAHALLQDATRDGVAHLGDTLVVVPGARAGRRLLELLVEGAAQGGVHLVPPSRILTPGSLPEELYRSSLPIASAAEARRAWVRALQEAPPELVRELFGAGVDPSDRKGLLPLARVLASLDDQVGSGGHDFRDVAGICRSGHPHADEARWTAMARVQGVARGFLREAGRVARQVARRAALEEEARDGRTVVLVGVVEMPSTAREILARRAGKILALVQAPEEARQGFDEWGLLWGEWWLGRRIPVEEGVLSIRDRPADQAAETVRFLAELEGAFAPEEVTLGITDRSLLPSLIQAFQGHGVPHRYAEGSPVASSLPALLLGALAQHLEGHRFTTLAALVRHPDLPAALDPSRAPELADEYFREHLPDRLSPEARGDPVGSRAFEAVREALRGPELMGRLRGRRGLREWAPILLGLLGSVYGERRFHPGRVPDRAIVESALRLRDGAEALRRLPAVLDESHDAAEALAVLLEEVREDRVPPPAGDGAIEIVGWLELHLDDAPVLILAGVNEPYLPEAVTSHPFLPDTLRGRLGLPDNRARLARDAYLLTAILKSRSKVLLVSGRRTESGDPLRPSRLLLTGDAREVASRILHFTVQEDDDRTSHSGGEPELPGVPPATGSAFHFPPFPRLPLPDLPRPLPITAFRGLMEDPFGWYLEEVLRLEEVDDDLHELDALGFGTLAHRILERFARTAEAASPDPARVSRRLDALLERASGERFGPAPLPSVPVQLEQLRTRLRAFAQWQASWVAEGWRIHATEARTPPEGVPFAVDGAPVFLSGRVDRIDRNVVTGAWMILDYKTGEGGVEAQDARSRDGRWKDLQLPLYRYVLGHLLKSDGSTLEPPPDEAPVGLAYLSLSRSTGPVNASVAPWTQADLHDAWEAARTVIRELRTAGEVVFQPSHRERRGGGDGLSALLGDGLLQGDGEG